MERDKQEQIQEHVRAIAAILYEDTPVEQLQTLEGIEKAVRAHILEHISPELGLFLSQQLVAQLAADLDTSKVSSAS